MSDSAQLFSVVRSAVGEFQCPRHHQEYTRMRNFDLLCEECPDASTSQHISAFFEKPLLSLVEFYSPLREFNAQVLTPGFLTEVRKNLSRSASAINSCLAVLEKSVVAQCKFMKEAYERLSGDSVRRLEDHLGYLEGVNRIYLDYFYEKLGTAELTRPEHVANLLRDFISGSEDPTNSLTLRLDYIRDIVKEFPFLKLSKLKELYSETCDPSKWLLSNFMENASRQQQPVIEPNLIRLLDRRHLLRFDSERVQFLNLNNRIVGQLKTGADLCFEIDKFRLVVSDVKELGVYSYLNPQQPRKLHSLPVRYPKNIKYINGDVFFLSEGKLQKYQIDTGIIATILIGKVKEFKIEGETFLVVSDKGYQQFDCESGKREPISKQRYLDAH